MTVCVCVQVCVCENTEYGLPECMYVCLQELCLFLSVCLCNFVCVCVIYSQVCVCVCMRVCVFGVCLECV